MKIRNKITIIILVITFAFIFYSNRSTSIVIYKRTPFHILKLTLFVLLEKISPLSINNITLAKGPK